MTLETLKTISTVLAFFQLVVIVWFGYLIWRKIRLDKQIREKSQKVLEAFDGLERCANIKIEYAEKLHAHYEQLIIAAINALSDEQMERIKKRLDERFGKVE